MPDNFQATVQEASAALAAGDFARSQKLFSELTRDNPGIVEVQVGLAVSLWKGGCEDQARVLFEELCRRFPGHPLVENLLSPWTQLEKPLAEITAFEYLRTNPHAGKVLSSGLYGKDRSEIQVFQLDSIAVIGADAALLTAENKLLRESTIDTNVRDSLNCQHGKFAPRAELSTRCGDFVVLYGFWSAGFFHWILEWLPRAIIAEHAGFTGTYIIPKGGTFIKESLLLLGIAEERIELSSGASFIAERLFVPESITAYNLTNHIEILQILRDKLLAAASQVSTGSAPERIYISRKNPNRPRRVINEAALESKLSEYGVVSYDLDGRTLSEQIALVRNATVLIGPHGAGIIHALFMQPGSLVLELYPPTYINPSTLPIHRFMEHRYFMIPSYLNGGAYPHGENIEAFIEIIDLTLSRELRYAS